MEACLVVDVSGQLEFNMASRTLRGIDAILAVEFAIDQNSSRTRLECCDQRGFRGGIDNLARQEKELLTSMQM
ncbi:hypothetical protein KDI_49150 [Dictyobacter arantiisoli]|uniref:Uncharacterized protein n=1 Tax=Dictyobacter arantiisoli TaxID=2014874 RepID=A0A5A5TIC0_9CHLR|nr:hypothetical protein KDI_49150 [Dictyobacter arantiisoli]